MISKKLKLYLDTSVYGGYFDIEFKEETKLLFEDIFKGKFEIMTSDLVTLELIKSPNQVRDLYYIFHNESNVISINNEVELLANEYLNENVVGRTSKEDCLHIATATIFNADILVSWNFKHIGNISRIRGYNSVNLKYGYNLIDIRSPKELINYEPTN